MELALEKLAEHGIMGLFLIMTTVYFVKTIKELKEELSKKDDRIQQLNDQLRDDAIENISLFKDTQQALKELTNELKIRNNG